MILYELHWRRRRQRRARGSRKEKQGVLTVLAAVPLEQKRLPLTLHGAGGGPSHGGMLRGQKLASAGNKNCGPAVSAGGLV